MVVGLVCLLVRPDDSSGPSSDVAVACGWLVIIILLKALNYY